MRKAQCGIKGRWKYEEIYFKDYEEEDEFERKIRRGEIEEINRRRPTEERNEAGV